jgi:hypothetical protein
MELFQGMRRSLSTRLAQLGLHLSLLFRLDIVMLQTSSLELSLSYLQLGLQFLDMERYSRSVDLFDNGRRQPYRGWGYREGMRRVRKESPAMTTVVGVFAIRPNSPAGTMHRGTTAGRSTAFSGVAALVTALVLLYTTEATLLRTAKTTMRSIYNC